MTTESSLLAAGFQAQLQPSWWPGKMRSVRWLASAEARVVLWHDLCSSRAGVRVVWVATHQLHTIFVLSVLGYRVALDY
ncbi:MAG: hypothetical protein ABIK86_07050 [candidate division WOR-3 bacterium]